MSAYTPKMGGIKEKTIDYAANASIATKIPAILRLNAADRDAPVASSMKIQIQSVGAPGGAAAGLHAAVDAQRAAYLKLIQPVQAPAKSEAVFAKEVLAEHELMSQIPRLKETLAALDSEMHANACSDVDKRMLVHERIMQLQGAQLSMVQKSVTQLIEQQARQDVDSDALRKTTMLHAKLHKAAGTQVLATAADVQALKMARQASGQNGGSNSEVLGLKQTTQALRQTVDLHTELHKASGAGVLALREKTKDLRQTVDLHNELHKASGAGVLALREKTKDLVQTRDLHTELHKASGAGVLALHEKVKDLREVSELHSELHKAGGTGVLALHSKTNELQYTSDLHTKLHKASGEYMTQNIGTGNSVGASAEQGNELRKLRKDLDVLVSENSKLKASVAVHDELHRTTSSIVCSLGKKTLAATSEEPCTCTKGTTRGHCRCKACNVPNARSLAPMAAEAPSTSHARILSMLQTDITSSNKPRQNRGY
jgi:hypothetical protein